SSPCHICYGRPAQTTAGRLNRSGVRKTKVVGSFQQSCSACARRSMVCLITRDGSRQPASAGSFIEKGAWVSVLARIWSHTCFQRSDRHGTGNKSFEEENDKQHTATD